MRLYVLLILTLPTSLFADSTLPSRDGFIEVPGGPVWYRVTGDTDSVPLLVLHGGPGGTSCYFSALEPLGAERPVIRYDQLGTGRSARPSDLSLWQLDRFVEGVDAVRKNLGLDEIHLLGHSWGGALAAQYVLDKGSEGIVSLTLSSPLLSTPLWIRDANALRAELPDDVRQTLDRHETAGTTDSPEYAAATAVFYERHVFDGERIPNASCDGAPGNSVIYEYMWGPTEFYATGNLIDFDVTDRLGELDMPVLFIAGEHDEARPETLAGFRARVPGSRLVVIQDAAHASLSKQPEAYRAALRIFLDEAGSARQP